MCLQSGQRLSTSSQFLSYVISLRQALAFHHIGRCFCNYLKKVVRFHLKLGKSVTQSHSLLKEIYVDEAISVFEWFKYFKSVKNHFGDDLRSGGYFSQWRVGNM